MKKLLSPRLPTKQPPLRPTDEIWTGFFSKGELEGEEDRVTQHAHFQQVQFTGDWTKSEWSDVLFERCDFSGSNFSDASFYRVQFHDCKLDGVNLSGCVIRNGRFDQSRMKLASFGFSNFKMVRMQDCALDEADFYELRHEHFSIDACTLHSANFGGVVLKDFDLSTCSFERIIVSIEKIAGCIISPEQAVGFVKAIGMVVKED
ncbi:pentapeptide repeat-containing protein [Mangrovibacillus cuniculi]|uniref:Pentapeptide repeat-containing protein n=1 Tax=Mangrovibacillus cuniculi TaxID=2593652 RepID=A0A7S8C9J7_9BACI|nr:pentapeptide repeat-containing protein [Mangrovibacillus cuniculi]QPC45873.1 pentapeptide repeat-containing protein [Mangrovibacillus cuniculi]